MYRYLACVLVFTLAGAILPLATFIEQMGFLWIERMQISSPVSFQRLIVTIFLRCAPVGAALGTLLGVGAAFVNHVKNRNRDSTGLAFSKRLILNLFWCNLYVLPLVAINVSIIRFLIRRWVEINGPSHIPYQLFAYGPILWVGAINVSALLWITICSVNANTITPRVATWAHTSFNTIRSRLVSYPIKAQLWHSIVIGFSLCY